MNVCAFTGRFTADPQLKYTQSQKAVCSFALAVGVPGSKDNAAFIDFVAWGPKAEFITKNFKKGMKAEVSGYATTRMYESNGKKIKATEIKVETVEFAERKRDDNPAGSAPAESSTSDNDFAPIEVNDGELPF
jgi:single-strand DNA-binding protein